ncbi:MAG: hypothetical protein Q9165_006187 [Trypethelium subeluteriae]
MPQFYPSISAELRDWALAQPLFFTASAPLTGSHINVSPKGLPASTLSVLSPNLVGYVDATGSGCETISHIYENGRVTLMFCGFGKSPRIMRWFCHGRVVESGTAREEFEMWMQRMGKELAGARAVILLDVWKVQTACGFGVPLMGNGTPEEVARSEECPTPYQDRSTLGDWAGKMVKNEKILEYQKQNNSASLDGLPGLKCARKAQGHPPWMDFLEVKAKRIIAEKDGLFIGAACTLLIMLE